MDKLLPRELRLKQQHVGTVLSVSKEIDGPHTCMNALILIVEDEAEIAEILDAYFMREGFRTVRAGDGQTALDLHLRLKPDLIILDVKLPKLDGYEVLATIRRRDDTPILMATALTEDLDKLQALRIGADDYVVKPFNPLEVVARARAILRRTRSHGAATVIRAGKIEIDLTAHSAVVISDGGARQKLDLTLTEFRILVHMCRAANRAFSRAELVDACLPEGEAMERTVDSHISNVRRKLEAATATGYLEGVRGVGYRLVPVT